MARDQGRPVILHVLTRAFLVAQDKPGYGWYRHGEEAAVPEPAAYRALRLGELSVGAHATLLVGRLPGRIVLWVGGLRSTRRCDERGRVIQDSLLLEADDSEGPAVVPLIAGVVRDLGDLRQALDLLVGMRAETVTVGPGLPVPLDVAPAPARTEHLPFGRWPHRSADQAQRCRRLPMTREALGSVADDLHGGLPRTTGPLVLVSAYGCPPGWPARSIWRLVTGLPQNG